jgi:hypothetical protein
MMAIRIGLGLVCALMLAGCASATAFRVDRSDVIGPCQTAVPDRDVLFGVALSGGGSRAALFGEAGLEALARLRTADGASVIDKISHLSSVSGGSIVLNSECDRQLLFTAASKLVDENRDRILEFLNRP